VNKLLFTKDTGSERWMTLLPAFLHYSSKTGVI